MHHSDCLYGVSCNALACYKHLTTSNQTFQAILLIIIHSIIILRPLMSSVDHYHALTTSVIHWSSSVTIIYWPISSSTDHYRHVLLVSTLTVTPGTSQILTWPNWPHFINAGE